MMMLKNVDDNDADEDETNDDENNDDVYDLYLNDYL